MQDLQVAKVASCLPPEVEVCEGSARCQRRGVFRRFGGRFATRRVKGTNVMQESSAVREDTHPRASESRGLIQGLHGVRYQVRDVSRSIAFYTDHLGFKLEHQQLPAFAQVSFGEFKIFLSGPEASGSRPMPDGRQQQPGGWNRVVLRVDDLPSLIRTFKKAGLSFRNAMEVGPGGKQIQVEDPDGNPIELFEPAR
jgi:glyoxylase I family protein